jgi:hypothetical protein
MQPKTKTQKCIKFFKEETFFVILCSFLQGFQNISRLGIFMFLKEELHLRPETITIILALVVFPYGIKPIFGYGIDWINSRVSRLKTLVFVTSFVK